MKWNKVWYQALTTALMDGELAGEEKTVCFPLISNLSGEKLRMHFSNIYGKEDCMIGGLAVYCQGRIADITVDGQKRFKIQVGEYLISDELDFPIEAEKEFEIRIYYETAVLTGNAIEEEARTANGNMIHSIIRSEIPMEQVQKEHGIYSFVPILQSVEVLSETSCKNIVFFGDSITAMNRWTKPLAERLRQKYRDKYTVINSGIPGNCMLYNVPGAMGKVFGETGITRFKRDVLDIPNLYAVVFALGSNDMSFLSEETCEVINLPMMTRTMMHWLDKLHTRNVRTIAQTITPRQGSQPEFTNEMEELRQQYNAWLRDNHTLFDYVIDFDACVCNPEQPNIIDEALHQGDYLHPNAAGGEKMAAYVDLNELVGE